MPTRPPIPDRIAKNPRRRKGVMASVTALMKGPSLRARAIAQEGLSQEEINQIIDESANSSDRSACILLTAFLERGLIQIIAMRIGLSPDQMNELRERDGALSTFYGNIRFAFALGIISKEMRNDLEAMRRTRNLFAHTPFVIHFTTPEINREILKLRLFHSELQSINAQYGDFSKQKAMFFASFMAIEELYAAAATKIRDQCRIIARSLEYTKDRIEIFL